MLWAGIDEAGYGPNLGPLVMTAVVAASPDEREPDVWADLHAGVARAGDPSHRVWVDDSKAILRHPSGRARLQATCLALVAAARGAVPASLAELLSAVGAGTLDDAELSAWLDDASEGAGFTPPLTNPCVPSEVPAAPFEGAGWRVVGVHSVVIGPAQFNASLARSDSKAEVHFRAFARLLGGLWAGTHDGQGGEGDTALHVRSDKHGGRHFYYDHLLDAFPDVWIDRGPEGPTLSRYTFRSAGRRLELRLEPRADATDGLVALASIVSKSLREFWMDRFNAYWTVRIPGLRPTAGYPVDAHRFREAIEPHCAARGLAPSLWWRLK
jgi:hypothetical protein